ncbi:PqiB family protein [Paraburkholderia bannensis]|uniref:PqiB family protein n=1 Tax=Paraburkholderia bannensis TaxID=765414 RepID=UPI002AB5E275|nr:MlaD family protein [Paraburkholderia bannensis]
MRFTLFRRYWRVWRVWPGPTIAALAGIAVLVHIALMRGPELCITFTTGEGLQVGKTLLRYRSVEIGRLEAVHVASDRSHVTAVIRLERSAARLRACGTRFWVVRPHIDGARIAEVGTLINGPYIAAEISRSTTRCQNFVGLEAPPVISSSLAGSRFALIAASRGSIEAGAPVFFRRVQVGRVLGYTLHKGGEQVDVDVFVKAPYDRYVTASSHWWRASAIDMQLTATGLRLETQSLAAILDGGVQFDSPGVFAGDAASQADARTFTLSDDRPDAAENTTGPAAPVSLRFRESLRGLVAGAPVDFRGVQIGEVVRVDADRDVSRGVFDMVATVNLYPYRLGRRYRESLGHGDSAGGRALLRRMIEQGLRGQLRMGNALTGQRYIALDFFPHAPAVHADVARGPVELPTVPNAIEELQDQLSNIVARLDRVPFDRIGQNLDASLTSTGTLFKTVNDDIAPQAQSTLLAAQHSFAAARAALKEDAPLQSDVREALAQLKRTLASVRALADYLERHPESIVWGKASQP